MPLSLMFQRIIDYVARLTDHPASATLFISTVTPIDDDDDADLRPPSILILLAIVFAIE